MIPKNDEGLVKYVSNTLLLNLKIKTMSDLHLGSGRADVNIDADIAYNDIGIPYFPAKRLKGLLYESAAEVYEMALRPIELQMQNDSRPELGPNEIKEYYKNLPFSFFYDLAPLFGHDIARARQQGKQMIIHNMYLQDYADNQKAWEYLTGKYPSLLNQQSVIDEYTYIRYQTQIDEETGIAVDHSLRNMRVVKAGCTFVGNIEIINATEKDKLILAAACANLRYAGGKRNRGLGKIKCSFDGMEKIIEASFGR